MHNDNTLMSNMLCFVPLYDLSDDNERVFDCIFSLLSFLNKVSVQFLFFSVGFVNRWRILG